MKYSAKYYDGITSLPKDVLVVPGVKAVHVGYTNLTGLPVNFSIREKDISSWYHTEEDTIIVWSKAPEQKLVLSGILNRGSILPIAYHSDTKKEKSGNSWLWALLSIMLLIGGGVAFYFYGLDAVAYRMAEALPREWEISVGKMMIQQERATHEVDAAKSLILTNYITKTDLDNTRGYDLDVTVIKSNQLNAYAIPGGHIVIYSALLDSLRKPEQLAAVLAHEWIHIRNQHTTKIVLRSFGGYLLISQFFSNLVGLASEFLNQAQNLIQLSYSREIESEADADAIIYLKRNKIDPRGIISLLELLKRNEKGEYMPAFLNTHPGAIERIQATSSSIKNIPQYNTPISLLHTFEDVKNVPEAIEGIVNQLDELAKNYADSVREANGQPLP